MRKAIEQLKKLLADFIEQRDDLMLVLACPPAEAALMLNLLLERERSANVDLFYLVAEDFTADAAYVDAIAARLKRDYDASVESADALPDLPVASLSASEPPTTRLHAALGYTRGLIPRGSGHRVIWGLGPAEIADLPGYTALLSSCLPRPKIEPWMRGLRMIARVPEEFSENDALAKGPRVRFQRFIIPPDAAENELRETSQDAGLPDATRIEALLQLSFIDVAHDRLDVATAGFQASLAHYRAAEDLAMQVLAMIGLADCSRRAKDIDGAKAWFETAIEPAGKAKQLVSLSIIAQHLAAIAFEQQKFEDAVFYYDQLTILKRSIPDEDGLVEALLWRGRAEEKAAKKEPALASWEEAILLCKTFELDHREEECLSQLHHGFTMVGRPADGDKAVAEWKSV